MDDQPDRPGFAGGPDCVGEARAFRHALRPAPPCARRGGRPPKATAGLRARFSGCEFFEWLTSGELAMSEADARNAAAWLRDKNVGVYGVSDFLSLKEADVAEFAKMLSKRGGKGLKLRWSESRSVRLPGCVVGEGLVSSTGGGSVFTTNPNSLRDPYQYGPSPSLGAHPSVGVPDTTTELKVLPSFSSKSALSL